jgi:nucleotide-binding universal stress UspA family protein
MTSKSHPAVPLSILHPTDFSEASMQAFCHALKIAVQYRASLSILHVESDDSQEARWEDFPGVRSTLQSWGLLSPGASRNAVYDELSIAVEKIEVSGPVIPAILNFLDHHPFDLMVLSTHGREGLPGWLHRGIAEPLARRALLPTLFVPETAKGFVSADDGQLRMRRLLMPVDHNPSPRYALGDAIEVLEGLGDESSELTLLHVGKEMPEIKMPGKVAWKWTHRQASGNVVDAIVSVAESIDADLILMVTAGHQGFLDVLRGSTSERVLRHARCPVLTIPGSEERR